MIGEASKAVGLRRKLLGNVLRENFKLVRESQSHVGEGNRTAVLRCEIEVFPLQSQLPQQL